jgi:predicted house-cleaning noncanonical NTP pyrophosphatase (MazG superfamily)
MAREIPQKLIIFLKNAIKDVDDGYEYSSELNRILNSDECQTALTGKEIEALRDYSDKIKKIGEINYYSEQKIKDIETEFFGGKGILGFLGVSTE